MATPPLDAVRYRATAHAVTPLPLAIPPSAPVPTRSLPRPLVLPTAAAATAVRQNTAALALKIPDRPPSAGRPPGETLHLPAWSQDAPRSPAAPNRLRIWDGLSATQASSPPPAQVYALSVSAHRPGVAAGAPATALDYAVPDAAPRRAAAPPRALLLDPLFNNTASATNWRTQQLTRQTAQQEARAAEWREFRRLLYEWLLSPPKSDRSD